MYTLFKRIALELMNVESRGTLEEGVEGRCRPLHDGGFVGLRLGKERSRVLLGCFQVTLRIPRGV